MHIESTRGMAIDFKDTRDSLDVIDPESATGLFAYGELLPMIGHCIAACTYDAVIASSERHERLLGRCNRENETAIVISVFANEVHATGGVRDHLGQTPEHVIESAGRRRCKHLILLIVIVTLFDTHPNGDFRDLGQQFLIEQVWNHAFLSRPFMSQ